MDYVKEIECKIIVDLKGIDKVIPKLESSLKDLKGEREHIAGNGIAWACEHAFAVGADIRDGQA